MSIFGRRFIKVESKDEELNKQLEKLDDYGREIMDLIPGGSLLESEPEEYAKIHKLYIDSIDALNVMFEILVNEHDQLNNIDTKLDGIMDEIKKLEK